MSGDTSAAKVTQSYAMQRWMMAGAGRGACAMKYNGATFTVWGSTNVTLPLSNWIKLGYMTNVSAGQYQFTDTNAPANARGFYRVSSP